MRTFQNDRYAGPVSKEADVFRILERFRLRMSLEQWRGTPVTLDSLVEHYVEKELPSLRYGTQRSHLCSLNRWIRPRLGRYLLHEVKPAQSSSGWARLHWRQTLR
jgi:hypothetical protein